MVLFGYDPGGFASVDERRSATDGIVPDPRQVRASFNVFSRNTFDSS
jgi:hypothetical protein